VLNLGSLASRLDFQIVFGANSIDIVESLDAFIYKSPLVFFARPSRSNATAIARYLAKDNGFCTPLSSMARGCQTVLSRG